MTWYDDLMNLSPDALEALAGVDRNEDNLRTAAIKVTRYVAAEVARHQAAERTVQTIATTDPEGDTTQKAPPMDTEEAVEAHGHPPTTAQVWPVRVMDHDGNPQPGWVPLGPWLYRQDVLDWLEQQAQAEGTSYGEAAVRRARDRLAKFTKVDR